MRAVLPLRRVCLEVDRTLRGRPFFARLLRGALDEAAYADLLGQLRCLVAVVAPADKALFVADEELALLGGTAPAARPTCAAFGHFGDVVASFRPVLGHDVVLSTTLMVSGTSWSLDATEALLAQTHRTPPLLAHLAQRGPAALQRLETLLQDNPSDGPCIFAFAELTRGAFLGLSAYLELTWPSPLLVSSSFMNEEI